MLPARKIKRENNINKSTQKGFILLEISIALALLLLLVMLNVPHVAFLNRHLVSSEIDKLHALFIYLQHKAVASNREQVIQFDQTGYYYKGSKILFSKSVQFGSLPGVYGPPSSPQQTITKTNTFKDNRILFYKDGTIQSGSLYFIDTNQRYMYALTVPIGQVSSICKYAFEKKWNLVS